MWQAVLSAIGLATAIDTVLKVCPATGRPRSKQWPTARAKHLRSHPECVVCGATANLDVHHCVPFHIRPDMELNPSNLITLCRGDETKKEQKVNCHWFFGHLMDPTWHASNQRVREDAAKWREKILSRR